MRMKGTSGQLRLVSGIPKAANSSKKPTDAHRKLANRHHLIEPLRDFRGDCLTFGHAHQSPGIALRNLSLAPHIEHDFMRANAKT